MKIEIELPKTKECHCGHTAHKYRARAFINQLNMKVFRVFYRCEHCSSRINEDFCPDMDNSKTVPLEDMRKMFNTTL